MPNLPFDDLAAMATGIRAADVVRACINTMTVVTKCEARGEVATNVEAGSIAARSTTASNFDGVFMMNPPRFGAE